MSEPRESLPFLRAILGGLWGGAVAGLAEAAVVASTSGALPEYQFLPYAVIGYALLGALMGAGIGVLVWLVRGALDRMLPAFGLGAGLSFAALAFVVGRYHVNQLFFHEELSPWSASGAAAYLGLLGFGAAGLVAALIAGRQLREGRYRLAAAAGALLALFVVALAIGRSKVASDTLIGPGPATAAQGPAPNVILIIADTLRADALSAYGGRNQTPHIDRLASAGVRFAHAYAQASWTRPSIATILTSLLPSSHGATHKTSLLPDRVETVAEAFRGAGYWTTGYVSNINIAPVFNFQQGFAEYTYLPPDFYFWASDSSARLALYQTLRMLRERFLATRIFAANFYKDADQVTRHTVDWIDRQPREPFFLLVHYMDPHDPYFEIPYDGRGVARVTNPSPAVSRRDELHDLYLEDVRYLDGFIGKLWEELKAKGLYDNTMIVLTADHGEEFLEHGGWWHGTTLYEEQLHVPLIVKRPHESQPGTVVDTAVRSLDIAPTMLATAGVRVPATYEGRNLFGAAAAPDVLLAETDLEGNILASVRIADWKLITANENNPRQLQPVELYDLAQDPAEKRNLAEAEPQRVNDMLAALSRQRGIVGPQGATGR